MRSKKDLRRVRSHGVGRKDNVHRSAPVERLISVLGLTAEMGMISAADIHYALGIPRATAHRLIGVLEGQLLLQKMPVRGRYAASPRLVTLANSLLASTIVYAPMKGLLSALSRKTGETHGVTVMSMGEVQFIAIVERSAMILQFQPGQRAPLHCVASGHVFLSSLEPKRFSQYLETGPWEQITPHTITSPEVIRQRIEVVRSRGYALVDSEYLLETVSGAVPVRNRAGKVVAALGVTAPKPHRTMGDIEKLIPVMKAYASRIGLNM